MEALKEYKFEIFDIESCTKFAHTFRASCTRSLCKKIMEYRLANAHRHIIYLDPLQGYIDKEGT